jgi:GNAT superfamily N-acetyltransferase
MPDLTYRHATPSDLPFIVGLIHDDNIGPSSDDPSAANGPDYQRALAVINADPNQEAFVVELDGQPIGTFQLTYIPGIARRGQWRGLVEAVHISPDHRNKGFGTAMMRWAIERCRKRGCGLVQLTSNKKRLDAHRFYRALGFEQTHEGFKYRL